MLAAPADAILVGKLHFHDRRGIGKYPIAEMTHLRLNTAGKRL